MLRFFKPSGPETKYLKLTTYGPTIYMMDSDPYSETIGRYGDLQNTIAIQTADLRKFQNAIEKTPASKFNKFGPQVKQQLVEAISKMRT